MLRAIIGFIVLSTLTTHAEVLPEDLPRLVYFNAGHLRKKIPKQCSLSTVYTVTAKSNSLTIRMYEKLLHGHLDREYSLIEPAELTMRSPYIVPECLRLGYAYLVAGDIYQQNGPFFEGIVVGVPKPGRYRQTYICSIKRNNGIQPLDPQPDLGPFRLGYQLIEGLEPGAFDWEIVSKKTLIK